jgi:hypothetical protein
MDTTYEKSWTEGYQDLALTCINTEYGRTIADHLLAFGSLNDVDKKVPSWVPNWNTRRKKHQDIRAHMGTSGRHSQAVSTPLRNNCGLNMLTVNHGVVIKSSNRWPFTQCRRSQIRS